VEWERLLTVALVITISIDECNLDTPVQKFIDLRDGVYREVSRVDKIFMRVKVSLSTYRREGQIYP
jgi:hypothetical protein